MLADFVERDQVIAFPAGQHAAKLQLLFGLNQLVDQRRSSGEADVALLPARRRTQAG